MGQRAKAEGRTSPGNVPTIPEVAAGWCPELGKEKQVGRKNTPIPQGQIPIPPPRFRSTCPEPSGDLPPLHHHDKELATTLTLSPPHPATSLCCSVSGQHAMMGPSPSVFPSLACLGYSLPTMTKNWVTKITTPPLTHSCWPKCTCLSLRAYFHPIPMVTFSLEVAMVRELSPCGWATGPQNPPAGRAKEGRKQGPGGGTQANPALQKSSGWWPQLSPGSSAWI